MGRPSGIIGSALNRRKWCRFSPPLTGKEISQEQLGLIAGFDRTYISLIERGINSPTIRTVVKLALVLEVAPSKIVVRMEELLAGTKA